MTENKYMKFEQLESKTKTEVWWVKNVRSDTVLGEIKWYGAWRQYCFFPSGLTVFNRDCLDIINEFITGLMEKRKTVEQ